MSKMLNKYLKDVLNILEENCIGLIPCSKAEVDNLEHQVKSNLPVAYKEYLLSMGKHSGIFNIGTDCFYPDILDLCKYANDLLEENNTGLYGLILLYDFCKIFVPVQLFTFLLFVVKCSKKSQFHLGVDRQCMVN